MLGKVRMALRLVKGTNLLTCENVENMIKYKYPMKGYRTLMKKKRAILFDLDGTLLPMNQEEFTNGYFRFLAKKLAPYGYDARELVSGLWEGVGAMVKNDGTLPNDKRFWEVFNAHLGRDCTVDEPIFDEFYRTEFHQAQQFTGPNPLAKALVAAAREKADLVILATNPLFPRVRQQTRLSFIGLKDTDFDWVTDYENSHFCKPNPEYYLEILDRFSLDPKDCLMIGNDVEEDMLPTTGLGMDAFLITDCLISRAERGITVPHGTVTDALEYLKDL